MSSLQRVHRKHSWVKVGIKPLWITMTDEDAYWLELGEDELDGLNLGGWRICVNVRRKEKRQGGKGATCG